MYYSSANVKGRGQQRKKNRTKENLRVLHGIYGPTSSSTLLQILSSCAPFYATFPNTLGCAKSAMLMKISSAGCLYSGARSLFWSRWCPMKPIERPSTNKPLSVPIWIHVSPRTILHMKTATNLDILIGLLGRECARVAKEIDETNSDTTVDVQNQLMTSASANISFPPGTSQGNSRYPSSWSSPSLRPTHNQATSEKGSFCGRIP